MVSLIGHGMIDDSLPVYIGPNTGRSSKPFAASAVVIKTLVASYSSPVTRICMRASTRCLIIFGALNALIIISNGSESP